MFYAIVQELGGQIYIHGPWRTQEARDRRYESIQGGEVHRFNTFSQDPAQIRKEFQDERVKAL